MSNKEPNEIELFNKEHCLYVKVVMGDGKEFKVKQQLSDEEYEAITTLLEQSQINILNKAHRVNGKNDYDNETDEYIDELLEALEGDK